MTKSGKSTDSFTYLGRSYRFFAEIRHVLTRVLSPNFTSLKTPSCLSKTAQTWREKPANSSDMVLFSGKSFRLGEKIRLHESVHRTNLEIRVTSRKVRLKSAKNLYLRHRFFEKIRQIHRFFYLFRQKLQILCRNQARLGTRRARVDCAPAHAAHLARNPSTPSIYAQENRYPHEMDTGLKSLATCVRNLRTQPTHPSASS